MNFPEGIHVYGDKTYRGRCPLEKHEAQTFFALLRTLYPHLGAIAVHIRNEAKRSKWQTFQHKKEGLVSGASDIIIPGNPSCVIEMKRRDHKQSSLTDEQMSYLNACKENGSFVCVALGADAAMKAVTRWMQYQKKLEKHNTMELTL